MTSSCMRTSEVYEEPTPIQTHFELFPKETLDIPKSIGEYGWESSNEFVAYATDNRTIQTSHVGSAKLTSYQGTVLDIVVKPRYTIYDEPIRYWSWTKSEIRTKFGSPIEEEERYMKFDTGNKKAPYVYFIFTNGKVTTSGVYSSLSLLDDILHFLGERYEPLPIAPFHPVPGNDVRGFAHKCGKFSNITTMTVMLETSITSGKIVIDYSPSTSSRIKENPLRDELENTQSKLGAEF